MDITPPRESEGTEALRRSNTQRGIAPADAIAPAQALRRSGGGRDRPPERIPQPSVPDRNSWPHVERRSGEDRRQQGDRRGRNDPAWLDTRSNRERRTHVRRAADREQLAETPSAAPRPYGINTKA